MTTLLAASSTADNTMVLFSGLGLLVLLFWYFATEYEVKKRNIGSIIVATIAVFSLFAIISPRNILNVFQGKTELVKAHNLKGGIEIVGGTSFILEVQPNVDETGAIIPLTPEAVQNAKDIVEKRINKSGVADVQITIQGKNRIEIQMPGVTPAQADEIERQLSRTAKLTIHRVHEDSDMIAEAVANRETRKPGYKVYPQTLKTKEGVEYTRHVLVRSKPALTGKDVKRATPDFQSNTQVNITLTGDGAKKMEDFTRALTPGRDYIATVLEGEVKNAAVLNADVLSQNFVISGLDDIEECKDLAQAMLNPLENEMQVLERRTVSATLGDAVVKQGINAGMAGLAITFVFVLLYYRLSGVIALVGLTLNVLILFGAMALFGASFTLPGIAGIVLTIGVAVDANVLIYERLREELALGKSVKAAINAAYDKAFSAIFDANITTLITAMILFWKATGSVKGFAVTLTIGIMGTLLAALLCTRVLFWWSTDSNTMKKIKFMNLVPQKAFDFLSTRKVSFTLSIILIIGGMATLAIKGEKNLGIDFTGGNVVRFDIPSGQSISQTEVQQVLDGLTLGQGASSQIEATPGATSFIAIKCGAEDRKAITESIRNAFADRGFKDKETITLNDGTTREEYIVKDTPETVSPTLGGEFLSSAIMALVIGLFAILVYITIRFEFSFAVGAFFALGHDVLVCLGLLVIFGQELSLIHVGAFLTIAGYSINDTIVVFDRIREVLQSKRDDVKDIMNGAISATLSRTVLTSATTFATVLVLYIFGGASLKDFSFAIMVGVVVGTYSSIFIASPIVYIFSKARGINLRRELLDANLEAEVNPAASK